MKLVRAFFLTGLLATSPTLLLAEEKKEDANMAEIKKEDAKFHCEKKKDGKTLHVKADTRKRCKKKGGRWVKGHKEEDGKDDHKHDEGKGHHDH